MPKKLCKLIKDDYLKDKEGTRAYIEMVKEPKYVCKKCGRAGSREDQLCDPKRIK